MLLDRRALLALFVVALAASTPAYANAGTPLMWFGAFHLGFGNAIIGVLEGILIARLFRTNVRWTAGAMILANYVSMWCGGMLLPQAEPIAGLVLGHRLSIYDLQGFLLACVILAFLVTLVIEWPFCLFALLGQKQPVRRSALACLVTQIASYTFLLVYYGVASPVSALTRTTLDDPANFAKPVDAWVYFIGADDGDIWRIRPDGSERQHVAVAQAGTSDACLFIRPSVDSEGWDLWSQTGHRLDGERSLELERFATHPALAPDWDYADLSRSPPGPFTGYGAAYLDAEPPSIGGRVRTGFWAAEGLWYGGDRIALETPFVRWLPRWPTVLPGEQVVYQLGDQIVLFDIPQRKLGLVAFGRGPLVTAGDDVAPRHSDDQPVAADAPVGR